MLVQKEFPWETYIYTAEDERILTLRYTPQNDKLREVYSLRDLGGALLRTYHTDGGSKGTWSWGNDFIHDATGRTLVDISNKPLPLRHKHYAHDHLGTPVVTTNQNGVIIGTDSLWAFGEPVDPNGSFTLKRFTGHERDYSPDGRTFDLDYMHARYYASQMGRFMSVDPAGDSARPESPQTWNRYGYGLNNPLVLVDPDGKRIAAYNAEQTKKGLEFARRVREKVRSTLGSVPKAGPALAFVADTLLSGFLPENVEELNDSMVGMGTPIAGIGGKGARAIGRAGEGLTGAVRAGDIRRLKPGGLDRIGIKDPEKFKDGFVPNNGGRFDIAKTKDGKVVLISKDGRTIIDTDLTVDQLKE